MSLRNEDTTLQSLDPLWEQLKHGNKAALQALYQEYANLLYNYGRHIVNDAALIKDCIQDLFIELWNNHQNLSSTTSVKFYLFKALRRKIVHEKSKIERQLSEQKTNDEKVEVHYLYEFPETDSQFNRKRKARLLKFVNSLPKRQKEVLTLIFFENLTRVEVAEIMGIDTATVYSLTWKGIKTLRKDLLTTRPILFLIMLFLLSF